MAFLARLAQCDRPVATGLTRGGRPDHETHGPDQCYRLRDVDSNCTLKTLEAHGVKRGVAKSESVIAMYQKRHERDSTRKEDYRCTPDWVGLESREECLDQLEFRRLHAFGAGRL